MKVKKSSVRLDVISFFSVLIIFTLVIEGFVVFSSWRKSSDEMVEKLEQEALTDITAKMDAHLDLPLRMNVMTQNAIKSGIVDVNDAREREIFFAGIMKSAKPNIYSYSYGSENGEYYGARRNPKTKEVEIMRSDKETLGNSTYYETNPDLTAGKVVEQLGKFDPRTRDWYKIAKETGEPVFSPTYTHFVMNDLAISAAYPLYEEDGDLMGVLGTHFVLSDINAFLQGIVEPNNASAFIFERKTGELIANTKNMPKFLAYPDKPIERITIDQIENDLFSKAYDEYLTTSKNSFLVDVDDDTHRVNIVEFKKNGLDWIIITTLPHGQFTAPIMRGFWSSLVFLVGVFLISLALLMKSSKIFLKPIDHLVETAGKYSEGDFSQRAKVFKNDEIGKLSEAFNAMADRFTATLGSSEEKMRIRESELEKEKSELTVTVTRMKNTLNSLSRAFISTDRYGDVDMMNAQAEKLTGWSLEDAIGVPFDEVFNVIHASTGEGCHSLVGEVFEYGELVEFLPQTLLVSRDGRKRLMEGTASPIQDEDGVRTGVVILFTENREEQLTVVRSLSS